MKELTNNEAGNTVLSSKEELPKTQQEINILRAVNDSVMAEIARIENDSRFFLVKILPTFLKRLIKQEDQTSVDIAHTIANVINSQIDLDLKVFQSANIDKLSRENDQKVTNIYGSPQNHSFLSQLSFERDQLHDLINDCEFEDLNTHYESIKKEFSENRDEQIDKIKCWDLYVLFYIEKKFKEILLSDFESSSFESTCDFLNVFLKSASLKPMLVENLKALPSEDPKIRAGVAKMAVSFMINYPSSVNQLATLFQEAGIELDKSLIENGFIIKNLLKLLEFQNTTSASCVSTFLDTLDLLDSEGLIDAEKIRNNQEIRFLIFEIYLLDSINVKYNDIESDFPHRLVIQRGFMEANSLVIVSLKKYIQAYLNYKKGLHQDVDDRIWTLFNELK